MAAVFQPPVDITTLSGTPAARRAFAAERRRSCRINPLYLAKMSPESRAKVDLWVKEEIKKIKKNPPHPGELIRIEIIGVAGLSVSKAAEVLKVDRRTLSKLLCDKAKLTPRIALRIEKAFGWEMDYLLGIQLAYDVAKTRKLGRSLGIKRYRPQRKKIEARKSTA